ncbi:MAG: sulfoxide reductase heme-binding subunit YedZ [Gammaproteobacteria bacterium]|nr:sulfoxide reductase heme-binding subunit YedZ [Gammaproteobacteria bacterium]
MKKSRPSLATRWIDRLGKPLLFVAGLCPLAWLFIQGLGVNPVETVTHHTGVWSLRFLLITLAITPMRRLTGWHWLARFRRMLGLYAFFYALLHFATYLIFDQFFDPQAIAEDVLKRPYITLGFVAFLMLIPLTVTSTNKMIKRLGGSRWQRLHRLVYVIGILAVGHYLWLVKADLFRPLVYASVLALLLGYRLWYRYRVVLKEGLAGATANCSNATG